MAEQQDQDQKTEEPTSKREEDARKEGQLPVSQEVRTWFMLFGGLIVIVLVGPVLGERMLSSLMVYFSAADQLSVGDGSVVRILGDTFGQLGPALGMMILVMVIAALAGTMVQTGFFMASKLIEPKLDRISPLSGWKRLFSLRSFVEFLKGALKITTVGIVVVIVGKPLFMGTELLNGMDPGLQIKVTYDYVVKLLITVLSVFTVIMAADMVYQRYKHYQGLRMTKQEVKDEMKQMLGDPLIRQRLARIRIQRAAKRMMARLPEADVVVTNPTHFAVALKYDAAKMRAPMVLAKGQDIIALRIRDVALAHDVPVMENPPLARALYAACEVDDEIPADHYKAVAEVISYVYRLKSKTVRA